jgi:CDP-diacylglycerol---glycerol-3-phosphate 3-phosphatidyltransferase
MDQQIPMPAVQPESPAPRRADRDEPAPISAVPSIAEASREVLTVPNGLTLFRIFLVPVLVVVLLTKFEGREYYGLAIFLIAAATDFLDGYLARRFHQITRLGILLDPIADKLLISSALISLVELKIAPAWMIVIIIGREFAVSGLRSIASQQGVTIAASPLGKGKMVSQVVAISFLILGDKLSEFIPAAFGVGEVRFVGETALWIVMIFAIGSCVDYFLRFSKAILER